MISVAEHNWNRDAETHTYRHAVEQIIIYPGYNQSTVNNDIALLKLSRPITYRTGAVPVCLPDADTPDPGEANCIVTGWGVMSYGGGK